LSRRDLGQRFCTPVKGSNRSLQSRDLATLRRSGFAEWQDFFPDFSTGKPGDFRFQQSRYIWHLPMTALAGLALLLE